MYFVSLLLIPLMAVLFRIHGGGIIENRREEAQILFTLIMGLVIANWAPFVFAAVGALMCLGGKATGHGQYMDLATWAQAVAAEKLDFIVAWFFGPDTFDNYWRDVLGLSVTGLAAVSGAIVLCWYNPIGMCMIFLAGMAKPIGYMAFKALGFPNFNEYGEPIAGAFVGAALAGALILT